MIPIGPLMREHRLIEHMISLMKAEVSTIAADRQADAAFLETVIDFFRTYGDRCHHGKEEEILFAQLKDKQLSAAHEAIVSELIEEHRIARQTTRELLAANERYKGGSLAALDDIGRILSFLVAFYPAHIAKEDKEFFYPCMEYFTKEELASMLKEFWEFDRKLIHEKYGRTVTELEETRATGPDAPPPFRDV
jgi:hemerythrin-like domain-containing protein